MSWEEKLSDKYRLDVPRTQAPTDAAKVAQAKKAQQEERQVAQLRQEARLKATQDCPVVAACENVAQLAELRATIDFWKSRYPNEPQRWQKYEADYQKISGGK